MLNYSVYVLFSEKDQLLYIGFSKNPLKRLEAHNRRKNPSTKYRTPLKLIYCEYYLFKADALGREQYFKTSMGKKALKIMLRKTLDELGYAGKKIKISSETLESEIKSS